MPELANLEHALMRIHAALTVPIKQYVPSESTHGVCSLAQVANSPGPNKLSNCETILSCLLANMKHPQSLTVP